MMNCGIKCSDSVLTMMVSCDVKICLMWGCVLGDGLLGGGVEIGGGIMVIVKLG